MLLLLFNLFLLCFSEQLIIVQTTTTTTTTMKKQSSSSQYQEGKIYEFYTTNLTSNLLEWETDMAIMFYSPRCKYCKQLLPSWQAIATATKQENDLLIGKFNCENPLDHSDLCQEFGVDRYPSVYFIGYGNYNQAPPTNPFGKNKLPSNLVRYRADLYPEAIYDWIQFLHMISRTKRRWNDFTSMFTKSSSSSSSTAEKTKWLSYKLKLEELEKKVRLFSTELEKYKAIELFESLEDYGDPFPVVHRIDPDEQNLPLRVCIADMAAEFCKYFQVDDYCKMLPACSEQDLEPVVCRPEECPFEDKRGCTVVSTCLKPGIIEQYAAVYSTRKTA